MSVAFTTCRRATARTRSSARKPIEARPQPDVRRRRPLRLQACDPLDRLCHREPVAPEEELARERRAVELAQRERRAWRHACARHGEPDSPTMRTSLVVLVFAFAGLLAVDLQSSAPACCRRDSGASRHGAEADAGNGRGRVREERLDRPSRPRRPEGHEAAEAALRELTQGPTRAERRRGIRTALPERARLRSLRAEGQTWFASFSRATLGTGSAETKRTRRWQIAATLAPLGDEESVALAAEGRYVTTARLGVRPGTWRAETGENDYPYVVRGVQLRLAALGYLDRVGRHGSTRLPHRAGAPRLPGLGGSRPHGHGHGADAGRAVPRGAAAAGVATPRDATSRSPVTRGSCSWSRTARSFAPCTRPRARWVARRPGTSRSTPRSLLLVVGAVPRVDALRGVLPRGDRAAPVTRRSLVPRIARLRSPPRGRSRARLPLRRPRHAGNRSLTPYGSGPRGSASAPRLRSRERAATAGTPVRGAVTASGEGLRHHGFGDGNRAPTSVRRARKAARSERGALHPDRAGRACPGCRRPQVRRRSA